MKNLIACLVFILILIGEISSKSSSDSLYVDSLVRLNLFTEFHKFTPQEVDSLAQIMLDYGIATDDLRFQGYGYLARAKSRSNLDSLPQAIGFMQMAETAFEQGKVIRGAIVAKIQLGNFYWVRGFYPEGIRYLSAAIEYGFANNHPEWVRGTYFNLARIYEQTKDDSLALRYFRLAYDHFRTQDMPRMIAETQLALGDLFRRDGQRDSAVYYFNEALTRFEQYDMKLGLAFTKLGLAHFALDDQQFDRVDRIISEAYSVLPQVHDQNQAATLIHNVGRTYRDIGRSDQAINFFEESYAKAKKLNMPFLKLEGSKILSSLYAEKGDYQMAYRFLIENKTLKDSIADSDYSLKLALQKTHFETREKEKEIEGLKARQDRQFWQRFYLLMGIGILAWIVAVLFYAWWDRNRAYDSLEAEKKKSDELVKELEQANAAVIQSEKMASLGQLTAGVAHEINNPINFVSASVEALKLNFADYVEMHKAIVDLGKDPSVEKTQALLEKHQSLDMVFSIKESESLIESITRGAHRTSEIVKALRTFSKGTQGNFEPADVHEGIDSALTILNHKIGTHITVYKNYDPNLPQISCQIDRLNQVFLNLLDNAIVSIKEKGSVSIITKQTAENAVQITIKDSGTGMDKTTLSKVFEPFFTTKDVGEGTGLGLSISYGIIREHGGKIDIESKVGQGSEFSIILPIQQI